jgi:hypothetical protein
MMFMSGVGRPAFHMVAELGATGDRNTPTTRAAGPRADG